MRYTTPVLPYTRTPRGGVLQTPAPKATTTHNHTMSACAVRGIRRIVLDRSGLGRLPSDEVRGAPSALATKLVEAEAAGERVREGKVLGVCLDGQKQSKCRRA
eukprot:scaffold16502_cov63-Phaeocystis_antarctica.AAC.6